MELLIIKVWAAAAWSDDELHPQEVASLRQIIESSSLSESEREVAYGYLEAKPDISGDSFEELDDEAREDVFRDAQELVAVDGMLKDAELDFLRALRKKLGLS